jgi:glycine/D-amino acid oxidase-like deaminating enzyme
MNKSTPLHFDVIIIGAGSVGVPLAFNLGKSGLKILVLDQAHSIGQGSNKKAIGGVRATHSDPAKISICLRSLDIMRNWEETYGDDIEWHQGGYSFVAYHQQEETLLMNLVEKQKQMGLNISYLDQQHLLNVVPDLNSKELLGGTYSPEDGYCSPLRFLQACYKQTLRHNAQFHFNEKATGLLIEHGKIFGVQTDRSVYHTSTVINAAGAWANEVANLAGVTIQVHPDSHEAGITEPVRKFLEPMIVDLRPTTGSSNFYFCQHTTGQIIFCLTPSPAIQGFDERETSEFIPLVSKRMLALMPRLQNIRIRRTWRGLYPMTPDGFPIVGWCKEVTGLFFAAGMCGQGLMLGPGLAELITRAILDKPSHQDEDILSYFSPYRSFNTQEKLQ